MLMTPGPKRQVLIRAGSFDYAEVVLGNSTHLVGPNNVGKTSLIATLQFLYIADFSEMRFNRPWDESQRYYFHSDESTILFETLTNDGRLVTMGLRGRGQLGNYQVDRFAFEGPYRREDFLQEDNRVRPFADVTARLSGERFFKCPLSPGQIRAAVVGDFQEAPALNMGIVPLKNPSRYGDFVYLLKNLLRLSHLSQKDVKDTLLNVYRHDIKYAVEIDLHREYGDHYAALTAEKTKLENLRAVAVLAAGLKESRDIRDRARRHLPALYAALVGTKAREMRDLEQFSRIKEIDRERLDDAERTDQARGLELEADNNEIMAHLTRLQDWISNVQIEGKTLCDYLPELAAEKQRNLGKQIDELTARIVHAGDPEVLAQELKRYEDKLKATREQRDKHATLLGTRLQGHLGKEAIADLSRIFHSGILRLPVETGAVEIMDEVAMVATLKEIHGKVINGKLHAAGMVIPLATISSTAIADLAILNEEIAELESRVVKTTEALDAARNMAQLNADRTALREHLGELEELARRYSQWKQNNASLPEKEKELTALKIRQKANLSARNHLTEEAKRRVQQRNAIATALENYRLQGKELDGIRPVPVDASWPMGTPDPEWELLDARTLNNRYSQTRLKHDEADAKVAEVLQSAESIYRDGFPGLSDDERIETLIEAVDTLKDREDNFKRYLGDVIKGMRATFNNMFQSYNALADCVTTINRSIGKVSISNLQQLSLELVENTEITQHYRSVSTSDLLDDPDKTDDAIKTIYATIENTRVLRLADWFGVRFEVTTGNGEVRRYDDLKVMESNGTTMAIKVLLNMVLIRAMLHSKKAFRLPFYIDEATQIDEDNLKEIIALANEKGFCPVLASTMAASVAEDFIPVRRVSGDRSVIDPKWRISRQGKGTHAYAA